MSQRLWEALAAHLTGAVQSPACSSLAGVAASLWPLPLPAFSLLHALQPPQVLSSRRNFFEHKSLGAGPWFSSQACLSSRCWCPEKLFAQIPLSIQLFQLSVDFSLVSYLSCTQTHAKKFLSLVPAPPRAHSFVSPYVLTER